MTTKTRKTYYDDGQLFIEEELLDGESYRHVKEWHENGNLWKDYYSRNKQYDGPYKTYWDNGNPKEEGIFKEGKYVGLYTWYHENGKVWKIHEFPPEGKAPMTDKEAKEFIKKNPL